MRIDIHKVVAAVALVILIAAVIWWFSWRKREVMPVHRELMDSISYHIDQAEVHQEKAREYLNAAEEYGKVYHDPHIDSARRERIGAEIWANAVRKADSLHKRSP